MRGQGRDLAWAETSVVKWYNAAGSKSGEVFCNEESVALGSMCSFIKTECKSNRQNSITSFKHNVDRAESKSEFGLRIGLAANTQDNQITRQVESE